MSQSAEPRIGGFHHLSLTVIDIEASVAWYQRLFNADRMPATFPHHGREDTGYGVLLVDPHSGVTIALHTNTGNQGEPFDESHTGLDHVSFSVATRDDLEEWLAWLDELGIDHTGIRDENQPFAYSTLVFRDPDNIQLELISLR